MKRSFPDSKICQGMGALSASRIAYGITEGLGRTELESTVKDISKNPFSLQLDGGLKGGKHCENFLVRYYDEKTEKCVDKFTMAKSVNVENSSVIADIFLGWSKENKINLKEDLVMMNTDHASTLRGSKTGAMTKIAEKAPNIATCDIGGDILHDINNLIKKPFYQAFGDVVKILDITRQDLGKSAKKTEKFIGVCSSLGQDTCKPKVWCRSRFLSRYLCVKERRECYLTRSSIVKLKFLVGKERLGNRMGRNLPMRFQETLQIRQAAVLKMKTKLISLK